MKKTKIAKVNGMRIVFAKLSIIVSATADKKSKQIALRR